MINQNITPEEFEGILIDLEERSVTFDKIEDLSSIAITDRVVSTPDDDTVRVPNRVGEILIVSPRVEIYGRGFGREMPTPLIKGFEPHKLPFMSEEAASEISDFYDAETFKHSDYIYVLGQKGGKINANIMGTMSIHKTKFDMRPYKIPDPNAPKIVWVKATPLTREELIGLARGIARFPRVDVPKEYFEKDLGVPIKSSQHPVSFDFSDECYLIAYYKDGGRDRAVLSRLNDGIYTPENERLRFARVEFGDKTYVIETNNIDLSEDDVRRDIRKSVVYAAREKGYKDTDVNFLV